MTAATERTNVDMTSTHDHPDAELLRAGGNSFPARGQGRAVACPILHSQGDIACDTIETQSRARRHLLETDCGQTKGRGVSSFGDTLMFGTVLEASIVTIGVALNLALLIAVRSF